MPDQAPVDQAGEASTTEDDEVSLLDLLIVLAKHKRIVLGVPLVAGVGAAIISLLMPNTYTGTTRILPPQQSASAASALLNQLGGAFGGLLGAAGGALGRNPSDLYIGMLKSRTIADNLITRFELKKVYDQTLQSGARATLQGNTTIVAGRDGIIVIEVDDKDPARAAVLANAYVDELAKLTKVLAVTEASQRRLFFERQLIQAKDNLTAAEVAARQGLQKGGLAQVDAQGRSMIAVTARLRAEISAKEVQLGAMRTFAAEGNPELQRTQQELEALRKELARVEGTSPLATGKPGEAGGSGLDNLGRLRDVKYYEFLYELLAKQYELAKIDEAKDATIIQVMDRAIEPDRKSKPRRALIVLLWASLALIGSILFAFAREAASRAGVDPQQFSRLETLRDYLRWK